MCQSLVLVIKEAKESGKYDEIIFTKGGDRFASNCPEAAISKQASLRKKKNERRIR